MALHFTIEVCPRICFVCSACVFIVTGVDLWPARWRRTPLANERRTQCSSHLFATLWEQWAGNSQCRFVYFQALQMFWYRLLSKILLLKLNLHEIALTKTGLNKWVHVYYGFFAVDLLVLMKITFVMLHDFIIGQDSTMRMFSTVHDKYNKSLGRASFNKSETKRSGLKLDQHAMPPVTAFAAGNLHISKVLAKPCVVYLCDQTLNLLLMTVTFCV